MKAEPGESIGIVLLWPAQVEAGGARVEAELSRLSVICSARRLAVDRVFLPGGIEEGGRQVSVSQRNCGLSCARVEESI